MPNFETTSKFENQYKSLPDQVKKNFKKQIELFVSDPNHPSLKTKKKHAASNEFGETIFESRINLSYRFLWKWNGHQIVLLLTIGHHEIVENKK